MKTTCPICEKEEMMDADDIILELDGYVFVVSGSRCEACGEEFVAEKETQNMVAAARKMGIWPEPLKLHRTLSKSGGSLVLRLPTDIERQLNLHAGEQVALSKTGNKLVIEPLG